MNQEAHYPQPEDIPPQPDYAPTVHLNRWQRIGRRTLQLFGRNQYHADAQADHLSAAVHDEILEDTNELEDEQQSSETITIALVTNANDIRFYTPTGEEVGKPDRYSSKKAAQNAFSMLTAAFLEMDPRDTTRHNIADHTGKRPADVKRVFDRLESCAPEDSIAYQGGLFSFGDITVASRRASPEELKNYRQQRAAEAAAKKAERKKELDMALEVAPEAEELDTDPEEASLLDADHALIKVATTLGERTFIMPLEDEQAILAAQCLEVIGSLREKDFSHRLIVKKILDSMNSEERNLVEDGSSYTITESVLETLRTLTNKMCITHEPHDRQFRRLTEPFSVVYADTAPTAEQLNDPKTATIFPPGTAKRDIAEYGQPVELNDTLQQKAARLVSMVKMLHTKPEDLPELSHQEALECLDFVMSNAGKQAIGAELKTKYDSRRLYRTTRMIRRRIIRPALGSGYGSAVRNRTIAGNHATGDGRRAMQVGGALPTTTKWHVGMSIRNEEHSPGKNTSQSPEDFETS